MFILNLFLNLFFFSFFLKIFLKKLEYKIVYFLIDKIIDSFYRCIYMYRIEIYLLLVFLYINMKSNVYCYLYKFFDEDFL